MAGVPRTFEALNTTTGGELERKLRIWLAADVSYAAMARLIEQEFGFRVSGETVRASWLPRLPRTRKKKGAAA